MTSLYAGELEEIAEVVETVSTFVNTILVSGRKRTIDVEVPLDVEIKLNIISKATGETLGFVGYTAEGEIGFITDGME